MPNGTATTTTISRLSLLPPRARQRRVAMIMPDHDPGDDAQRVRPEREAEDGPDARRRTGDGQGKVDHWAAALIILGQRRRGQRRRSTGARSRNNVGVPGHPGRVRGGGDRLQPRHVPALVDARAEDVRGRGTADLLGQRDQLLVVPFQLRVGEQAGVVRLPEARFRRAREAVTGRDRPGSMEGERVELDRRLAALLRRGEHRAVLLLETGAGRAVEVFVQGDLHRRGPGAEDHRLTVDELHRGRAAGCAGHRVWAAAGAPSLEADAARDQQHHDAHGDQGEDPAVPLALLRLLGSERISRAGLAHRRSSRKLPSRASLLVGCQPATRTGPRPGRGRG